MTAGVNGLAGRTRAQEKEEQEEAVEDEEVPEVTTEDECEDVGRSAGRYANTRRKARFGDEDDFS